MHNGWFLCSTPIASSNLYVSYTTRKSSFHVSWFQPPKSQWTLSCLDMTPLCQQLYQQCYPVQFQLQGPLRNRLCCRHSCPPVHLLIFPQVKTDHTTTEPSPKGSRELLLKQICNYWNAFLQLLELKVAVQEWPMSFPVRYHCSPQVGREMICCRSNFVLTSSSN